MVLQVKCPNCTSSAIRTAYTSCGPVSYCLDCKWTDYLDRELCVTCGKHPVEIMSLTGQCRFCDVELRAFLESLNFASILGDSRNATA